MLTTCLYLGLFAGFDSRTAPLDGVWHSDGYGFVLEIQDHTARLFSTAEDLCLPEVSTLVPLDELLPGSSFAVSGDGQRLSIGFPMEPHRISAIRLASLPTQCSVEMSTDANAVFEAFVRFFDANYPYFALYDVDWISRVAAARRRVNDATDDQALFDALAWLIAPIRDAHVALIANVDGSRQISAPGRARVLGYLRDIAQVEGRDPASAARGFRLSIWYESIATVILRDTGQMRGNDRLQYGMLTSEVGYLAFSALDGFGPQDATPEENLAATQGMLDDILDDLTSLGARSIVLDLSLNFGGSDYIAREVASRFLREGVHAYSKFAADAALPIVTDVRIDQSPRVQFDGDIFLLTSHITVSAAEVLTLSLRTQPHVTHVGETTRGALSDALSRTLPNGWQLNLSNEVYLDSEGQHWEGLGIPPDIEMQVLSNADPIANHQAAILTLLGVESSF
ncbi:MAG: S41 family peptidase [Pseudomonadota bacterium]